MADTIAYDFTKADPAQVTVPHVSVVVLSWNRKDGLVRCLESLSRLDYPNVAVFVFDNGSTAFDPRAVENAFQGVQFIRNERNLGVAGGKNAALKRLLGQKLTEFILLLDDDTIAHPRLVRRLVDVHDSQRGWDILQPAIYELERPDTVHSYGGRYNRATGRTRRILNLPRSPDPTDEAVAVDFAFGCGFFVHRSILEGLGLFDEIQFPLGGEDVDFCQRALKRSFGVATIPVAILWREVGGDQKGSRDPKQTAWTQAANRALLVRKHGRLPHRFVFMLLVPFLFAWTLVFESLRGRPLLGLARIRGLTRGLTRSLRADQSLRSADDSEWRPAPGE